MEKMESSVPPTAFTCSSRASFFQHRREHWNKIAQTPQYRQTRLRRNYVRYLSEQYELMIPDGSTVLEIGCGAGDLLAAINDVKKNGKLAARATVNSQQSTVNSQQSTVNSQQFNAGRRD